MNTVWRILAVAFLLWLAATSLPARAATTTYVLTLSPAADAADGYAARTNIGLLTWADIIGGVGNQTATAGTFIDAIYIQSKANPDEWNTNHRGQFFFDTSVIPDDATIVSAVFSVRGASKSDALVITPNIGIYSSNSVGLTLASSDYENSTATAISDTVLTYAGFTTGAYNDFPLNAAGLAYISLTGYTRIVVRNQNYDVAANPPAWSANKVSYLRINSNESATKPELEVTYTVTTTDAGVVLLQTVLRVALASIILLIVLLSIKTGNLGWVSILCGLVAYVIVDNMIITLF